MSSPDYGDSRGNKCMLTLKNVVCNVVILVKDQSRDRESVCKRERESVKCQTAIRLSSKKKDERDSLLEPKEWTAFGDAGV